MRWTAGIQHDRAFAPSRPFIPSLTEGQSKGRFRCATVKSTGRSGNPESAGPVNSELPRPDDRGDRVRTRNRECPFGSSLSLDKDRERESRARFHYWDRRKVPIGRNCQCGKVKFDSADLHRSATDCPACPVPMSSRPLMETNRIVHCALYILS